MTRGCGAVDSGALGSGGVAEKLRGVPEQRRGAGGARGADAGTGGLVWDEDPAERVDRGIVRDLGRSEVAPDPEGRSGGSERFAASNRGEASRGIFGYRATVGDGRAAAD